MVERNKSFAETDTRNPLWVHMNEEHGLLLLDSEMDEIIRIVRNIQDPVKKAHNSTEKNTCDIPNCGKIAPKNDIFCSDHRNWLQNL